MTLLRRLFGGRIPSFRQTASGQEKDEVVHAWTLHQRHCHFSERPQFWC